MLNILDKFEKQLPKLLKDHKWNSLYIDYHPPVVERVWRQIGDYRFALHRIHPCKKPLYHPHPWPTAVKIIEGSYEMGVGYGKKKPKIASRIILTKNSTYEFIDPNTWHYVKPIKKPVMTIMVSGKPFKKSKPTHPHLKHLSEKKKKEILDYFENIYST